MLYATVRALLSLALRLFYRVTLQAPHPVPDGPVLLVGNHPNGLVDPALVLLATRRPVTFLAKAPLFSLPVLGALLRALGALPVFRKQEDPAQMGRNDATLEAAVTALVRGRAITLFPEGKSHNEPGLAELRTGAARIALRAARSGARVRVVPVGLSYAEKHRFRSEARLAVGAPFDVPAADPDDPAAVRALTGRIAAALRGLMVDLASWEDLPVVETAEALWALRRGEPPDSERLRHWARGLELLRQEDPARLASLRARLSSLRRRLDLARAAPGDLALDYRPAPVGAFVLRELVLPLLCLPLALLGLVLFAVPYPLPALVARWTKQDLDVVSTVKLLVTVLLAPAWWALLVALAGAWGGVPAALGAALAVPPLAVLTRAWVEHGRDALRDVRVFLVLGSRARLKARLREEADALGAEVDALVDAYAPRVVPPAA